MTGQQLGENPLVHQCFLKIITSLNVSSRELIFKVTGCWSSLKSPERKGFKTKELSGAGMTDGKL